MYLKVPVRAALVQSLQRMKRQRVEGSRGMGRRRLWSNQNTTSFWCKSKKVTGSSKLTGNEKLTGSTTRQYIFTLVFFCEHFQPWRISRTASCTVPTNNYIWIIIGLSSAKIHNFGLQSNGGQL